VTETTQRTETSEPSVTADGARARHVAGRVQAIHTAAAEGARMIGHASIAARRGSGLEGDRYARAIGHYSADLRSSRSLTLIESEVIDGLRAGGIELAPGETRRNLTTTGIRLTELVGRRFRVGSQLPRSDFHRAVTGVG